MYSNSVVEIGMLYSYVLGKNIRSSLRISTTRVHNNYWKAVFEIIKNEDNGQLNI